MKELVVISGKGGTGKTSFVGSFAALVEGKVLADCDVDAADLHLLLQPSVQKQGEFTGGKVARILPDTCTACGKCHELCRFDAIRMKGSAEEGSVEYFVDPISCEGCGVCYFNCPSEAVDFKKEVNGQWFVSETRHGPLVHAKLGIAQENSGKLVTLVRTMAKNLAEERGYDLVLIDGSPGIGCPVIASLTGASLALVVTEPTLSGIHDYARICELTRHFGIKTLVCVNKHDLNEQMTSQIEQHAQAHDIEVAGRVRYDPAVTKAQIAGKSIVEYSDNGVARETKAVWNRIKGLL